MGKFQPKWIDFLNSHQKHASWAAFRSFALTLCLMKRRLNFRFLSNSLGSNINSIDLHQGLVRKNQKLTNLCRLFKRWLCLSPVQFECRIFSLISLVRHFLTFKRCLLKGKAQILIRDWNHCLNALFILSDLN